MPQVHARRSSRRSNPLQAHLEPLESRTFFSITPSADPATILAQANNAFAFDLLHELGKSNDGNIFFSPYSAATALEMVLQGANGQTASEIINTLHLPPAALAQAGMQALYQLLQGVPSTTGVTLSTANRLWVNQNFQLLDSFLSATQNTFGASPQTIDYSDPDAAAATINAWVSDQTHGKIQNLIPADAIDAYTRLILTNAIYFQGNWATAFNAAATHDASFQTSPGNSSTVQMMQQENELGYYQQSGPDGFQALDLPYAGNNLDMLVILPTTSDIGAFQSDMSSDLFSQIAANLTTSDVDVQLPKFQMNETYNLVPALQDLGIHDAFTGSADFSGISSQGQLSISAVIQKSFINVDETGTQAAAATGVVVTTSAILVGSLPPPPISFNADHPFLFAIRDHATNTILFLGSVADPGTGAPVTGNPPVAPTPPSTPTISPVAIAHAHPRARSHHHFI